jgi:predicted DNA-binding protein (UPF0251 family)
MTELQCIELTVDEFEAIRLADCERLYQEQAAERMNVSRPTFGRILDAARAKVADAIVHGKALLIEGGSVKIAAPTGDGNASCPRRDGAERGGTAVPPPESPRCEVIRPSDSATVRTNVALVAIRTHRMPLFC